jgi:hypothetical protein
MEGTLGILGLLLALAGVIALVLGLVRRAAEPGVASRRDAGFIAGGSALALLGLALRSLVS